MNPLLQSIHKGILNGDRNATIKSIEVAISSGISPSDILNEAMTTAMIEVGKLFEDGEYFVPEMLISAKAMKEGMVILKPLLKEADVQPAGKVVAGTVRGDMHDIGKNLVCIMLEGAGFEIIDLGADVSPESFIDAVQTHSANLLAMSALLTTTMPGMKTTIDAFVQSGLRAKVKIMVGGAPLTETYAKQIGADGYAPDASRAVQLAKTLMAG
jgi:5-methyltetrahydrofolate--homocysteine methyltransferase